MHVESSCAFQVTFLNLIYERIIITAISSKKSNHSININTHKCHIAAGWLLKWSEFKWRNVQRNGKTWRTNMFTPEEKKQIKKPTDHNKEWRRRSGKSRRIFLFLLADTAYETGHGHTGTQWTRKSLNAGNNVGHSLHLHCRFCRDSLQTSKSTCS